MGKTYRKEFEINTKKFTADVEFYQDGDNEYDLTIVIYTQSDELFGEVFAGSIEKAFDNMQNKQLDICNKMAIIMDRVIRVCGINKKEFNIYSFGLIERERKFYLYSHLNRKVKEKYFDDVEVELQLAGFCKQ